MQKRGSHRQYGQRKLSAKVVRKLAGIPRPRSFSGGHARLSSSSPLPSPDQQRQQQHQAIWRANLSKAEADDIFQAEMRAFEDMLPSLLKDPHYNEKYVAVVHRQLVDSDSDKTALVKRVYKRYGYRPIYLDRVSKAKEYVEFPSPE